MPTDVFEIELAKIDRDLMRLSDSPVEQENRRRIGRWMENVAEIQRRCREQDLRSEDFLALKNSQNPQERELATTFEHVYERPHTQGPQGDCVAVDWNPRTQRYEVLNGSNRLLVAHELKLKHYPAIVQAPDVATLRRLRSDSRELFRHEAPVRGQTQIEREHARERMEEEERRTEKQKQELRRKREQERQR